MPFNLNPLFRRSLGSLKYAQTYLALSPLLASIDNTAAVVKPSPIKIDPESGKPEVGNCDIDGDPDLYGLGVRLGMLSYVVFTSSDYFVKL